MEHTIIQRIVQAAIDKKAHDVVALDVHLLTPHVDCFVICHGNSEPHVQSIAQEVRKVATEQGLAIKGIEGTTTARWVLLDFGDVVVHVFHREDREYYRIERLWADALPIEVHA
jgi:ribosome-associated protein